MSEGTRNAVVVAIRDHGPITFAEFMEVALYGENGFYERPPVGAGDGSDFITSPHVHPVFGHLLASGLMELWDLLGRPEPFRLVEVGAGDGTLARQLLDAMTGLRVEYTAVERSTGARQRLTEIGGIHVSASIEGTEPHVLVANELLDNLPFRRFRGGEEVRIGLEGDRLVEVCANIDPDAPETIVPESTRVFLDELARELIHGYALLIDYGSHGATGGPVHGYRGHRVVEDLLRDPGSADITVGVDFDLIAESAREIGLSVLGTVSQRQALGALGFEGWIHDELAKQAALLDERQGLEAVRTWTGRSRATLLVDPSALGRMHWQLLATPGLVAASWFRP